MKNIIKKLLKKKHPNKYLSTHKRLRKILSNYGTKIDKYIWINSDKEIMHVNKIELTILKNADKKFKKKTEEVVKLLGSNIKTEIGIRYEPLSATAITLIAIAALEGLGYIGKVGAKTAHYRAEKTLTKGMIKAFPKKYKSMSKHADIDAGRMHEAFEQQMQGITGTIGTGYDQLAEDLGLISKKAGSLKTSTADVVKAQTQDAMQEQFNIASAQAGAGYENQMQQYSMSLENTRTQLDNQLNELNRRYQKARRHDRWYENL